MAKFQLRHITKAYDCEAALELPLQLYEHYISVVR